jgi:hypothetical protein
MHGSAAIAGIGESIYYKRGESPHTEFQLACIAIRRAVEAILMVADQPIEAQLLAPGSPFELESVLIEHEAVAEAAVVPSPDPVRLAVPKAYVLLAAGRVASPELAQSIMAFCRERVAPYKRIRRVEFGDLPKTISGKIRRVELRGLETSRPSSARGVTEFWEEDFSW